MTDDTQPGMVMGTELELLAYGMPIFTSQYSYRGSEHLSFGRPMTHEVLDAVHAHFTAKDPEFGDETPLYAPHAQHGYTMRNGSCFYFDVGYDESASAEAENAFTLAVLERANELMWHKARREAEDIVGRQQGEYVADQVWNSKSAYWEDVYEDNVNQFINEFTEALHGEFMHALEKSTREITRKNPRKNGWPTPRRIPLEHATARVRPVDADSASEAAFTIGRRLGPEYTRISMYKTNMADNDFQNTERNCSAHENYCTIPAFRPNGPRRQELVEKTMAHAVTRDLYGAAGYFDLNPFEQRINAPTWFRSPRKRALTRVQGGSHLRNRSWYNARDEPLADENRFYRLHFTGGDATMTDFSTMLKTFTMRKIIDAAAEGGLDDAPQLKTAPFTDSQQKYDTEGEIHDFNVLLELPANGDLDGHPFDYLDQADWVFTVQQHGQECKDTAVNIQRYYYNQIRDEHPHLLETRYDEHGMRFWDEALTDLEENRFSKAARRIDYLAAMDYAEYLRSTHPGFGNLSANLARSIVDRQWREIGWNPADWREREDAGPPRSLYWRAVHDDRVDTLFDVEDALRYTWTPPNTRAKARTALPQEEVRGAGWQHI